MYDDVKGGAVNPPKDGASEVNTLGYGGFLDFPGGDSVYHLSFRFEHSGSSLVVDFTGGPGLTSVGDESWGLDNVQVTLDEVAITSTSTTSATTSTTTATTPATTTTTSTTTLPSGDCDGEPVAATFASVDCRLVALLARMDATPGLGAFGPKLAQNIGDAKDDVEAGVQFCAASDLKHTRQRLKRAMRALIDYVHRLNGHAARRKLRGLGQEFVAAGGPIKADLKSLKSAVNCPGDAPVED